MARKQVPDGHVAATRPEELVTTALPRAFLAHPPTLELSGHAERVGQYGSNAHRTRLHQHGAVRAQRRCGDGYESPRLSTGGLASKPKRSGVGNGSFLPT